MHLVTGEVRFRHGSTRRRSTSRSATWRGTHRRPLSNSLQLIPGRLAHADWNSPKVAGASTCLGYLLLRHSGVVNRIMAVIQYSSSDLNGCVLAVVLKVFTPAP